jgi:hypothetical protein
MTNLGFQLAAFCAAKKTSPCQQELCSHGRKLQLLERAGACAEHVLCTIKLKGSDLVYLTPEQTMN